MLRMLWRHFEKDKGAAILAALFVVGQVIFEILIPTGMVDLIDKGINLRDFQVVKDQGAILVVYALDALLFGFISGVFAAKASTGLASNLRRSLFKKIQDFSFGNIDHFQPSSLITRLTTDVNRVQVMVQTGMQVLIRGPVMFVIALFMAYRASVAITVRLILFLPIMLVIMAVFIKIGQPWVKRTLLSYDEINQIIKENTQGIEVVKIFTREEREKEKFATANANLLDNYIHVEKLNALVDPGVKFGIFVALIITLWYGSVSVVEGSLTQGELISLLSYIFQILISVMLIAMVFVMFIMSKVAVERIMEVLDEEVLIRDPENPVEEVKDGSIEFQNVDFSYHKNAKELDLMDINLSIPDKAIVGILGGTGSGKTSLVQLIPRLYDVNRGAVYVGGVDVRDYSQEKLRARISLVLQNTLLFKGSIGDNLRWGNPRASQEDMIRAAKIAQAHSFIMDMGGYEAEIEQGGANLSGGQRQRLTIARALLKQPKILILDDATSALDSHTEKLLQEDLRDQVGDITQLIIAQRISSIQHADIIVVMDRGKVVGTGTHEELLEENAVYQEVYHSQQKGVEDHE